MSLRDFDQARVINQALLAVVARELGGARDARALALVNRLCDGGVAAIQDADCRVALEAVRQLAALLYSDDGYEGVEAGLLRGAEALRFQILNHLASYRGRLDVLESRPPSRPELPAIERKRRLRVLVVEDNRDSADSLKKLLEICGHRVAVAYTARGGLDAARELQPDVILCDIGLPDTDGFALAMELRREPASAGARLIAVTAYGTDLDLVRSKKAGFDLHLVKPVNPGVLLVQLES